MKTLSGLLAAALLGALFSFGLPTIGQAEEGDLINLAHLRFLTEPIRIDAPGGGREMAIVHIYSEAPDYKWVDASGEGISAVDDVARAAVVYLWQYERLRGREPAEAAEALRLARLCLEFVRYMQAEDGAFYNFVLDRQGTINRTGSTSYKSLEWWAMRALWALGEGVRVFDQADPAYAGQLAASYRQTERAIAGLVTNYGEFITLHGFRIPAWLPNGAADSTGIGLLGMAAYYRARPNPDTEALITKIADGIAAYRLGSHNAYPFGMFPVLANAPGYWHDWGAHQGHALVEAGMALKRADWIDAAAAEANSFFVRHLAFERFRDLGVVPNRLGQIAYGTNMIVQSYMALYRATGDVRYARYGGLAASWLFGNNMAATPMYDPKTGRVFDGINGPAAWRVNRNAGAESTIEGLLSLLVVADVPQAAQYLYAQPVAGQSYRVLEAEDGRRVKGQPVYFSGGWMGASFISAGRYVGLGPGDEMELTLEIPANGLYYVYVAHLRQAVQRRDETAAMPRMAEPPTIDGNLAEWGAVPALRSNSREQFLRGAGLWKGPDVDSHTVQFAWDADKLYLAAAVRAPQHVQPYTLSNVWQGEALWFYLASDLNQRSLSAKFTLAQTPDGPQVWDWINSRFLRGAQMAWRQTGAADFVYEAAIPWESVGIRAPAAGLRIGIEVGRGIGGNSFMDLTGRDPDIGSNLLTIVLTNDGAAPSDTSANEPVFLRVQIGDEPALLVPTNVSPDRDFWWLDRVTRFPAELAKGSYPLRYAYAGAGQTDDSLSKVDAFYVQPVRAERTFALPDGRRFTLTYDTATGAASWEETTP